MSCQEHNPDRRRSCRVACGEKSDRVLSARDQHRRRILALKVGDIVKVKILGVRFELNDNYVSAIAELVTDSS